MISQGELYIEMFIRRGNYKLEYNVTLYSMQLTDIGEARDVPFFFMNPIDLQKQCIILFLTEQFVYVAVI